MLFRAADGYHSWRGRHPLGDGPQTEETHNLPPTDRYLHEGTGTEFISNIRAH
jgi:hypothetical protein